MDEKAGRALRRKAIRLTLRGWRLHAIRKQVQRSRSWLWKWQTRFRQFGWVGLQSRSRRPQHTPHRYGEEVRRRVARIRRQLERCKVGLLGVKAIQRELRPRRSQRKIPCKSTINTILHEAGILKPPRPVREACYPQPTATERYVLHAMDWTSRYLEGGAKVYAFHTVDIQARTLHQTISADKSTPTACGHLLDVCQRLGIPAGLQVDNDAAFNGSRKTPRVLSPFVRQALYLGIELIFIPFAEPKRNGIVERLNGLWAQSFWNRRHFRSVSHVQRTSPEFERWYAHEYRATFNAPAPCTRSGVSPRQPRLTARQRHTLPKKLPITAGRIHFVRGVDECGDIRLLNETWHIDKRLAHQYVWATIMTHEQRLKIYYQRSAQQPLRRIKTVRYEIAEPVSPVPPEFRRPYRRRKMCTMSSDLAMLPKSKKRPRCR